MHNSRLNTRLKLAVSLLLIVVLFACSATVISTAILPASTNVAQAESGNAWDYTGTYYDNLNENLDGAAFRAELAELITSTHNTSVNSYDNLKSQFNITDANPETGSGLLWFYTGTQVSSYSGSTSNREHVWPKDGGAAFPEKTGPGCDLQHLRPTDSQLNSSRGSYSFDEVAQTSSSIVKQNGSTSYGKTADELCYRSGSFFYPAKGYRGATARILMYVQTRWGDQYNLKFVDSAGKCKTIGKISTLLKWHLEEPPTASEIYRNQKAYEIQGNRNPFIDHPEYATKIYCNDGNSYNAALKAVVEKVGDPYNNSQPLVSLSFQQANVTVAVGQTATLAVVANPTNAKKNLTWTSSNNNVATVSDGVVTGVAKGTATITVKDKDTGLSAVATITVKEVTGITLSGTPAKKEYVAGSAFSPTGITVTATYNDGSTSVLNNADCQWLDGVTKQTTLSQGTTTVVCKYGNFQQVVLGITVAEQQGASFEITRNSFSASSNYAFQKWSSGGVSGTAYIYGGTTDKMQFNNKKDHSYIASTTATPSGITSITVVMNEGSKSWTLLTSNTAYGELSGKGDPTSGTDHGKQTVTTAGYTWELDGTDTYFCLNYSDSGAAYIKSITVTYGNGGGGTITPTPDSVSLNKDTLNLEVGGSETLVATVVGSATAVWTSSNTNVATVDQNGKVTAVAEGTATITVTVGTATDTCTVTVTTSGGTVTPTPDVTDKEKYFDSIVADPTVGTDYKLAFWQENLSKVFYAVAEMTDDGFLQTTESADNAAVVRLEAGTYDECYYLKLGNKYISLNSTWGGKYVKASITLTDAPTTEFYFGTHNEIASVVEAKDDSGLSQTNTVYLGTHGEYSTVAASSTYYLESTTAIDVSQFVLRLVVASNGTVTPNPTPDSVSLNKDTLYLEVGGSETLVATVVGSATAVWTSSNTNVATVDQNGKVTAVAEGTATITVTAGTATATCTLTVEDVQPIVPPSPWTVTFDAQNGSDPVVLPFSEDFTLPENPTNGNKVFGGWYTDVACTDGNEWTAPSMLSEHIIVYAKWTDPQPEHDEEVAEFRELVSAVKAATGTENQFNAIKAALEKYATLTDEQKTVVAIDYQVLQNQVAAYNQSVTSANNEHTSALQKVLVYGSIISAGFVALLTLLKMALL